MAKKITKRPAPAVRKEQIVQAGLLVARRTGWESITYKAVAEHVGIAAPSLVYHYRTMTQLKRAIVRAAVRANDGLVVAMAVQAGDWSRDKTDELLYIRGKHALQEWSPCLT
ncbi:hypothetical protein [Vibrio phage VP16T]|nr:hypothetical protein [Vibrio phage VP16T]